MAHPALRFRAVVVVLLALAAITAIFFVPRFGRPPSYHNFADQRSILGIPNAMNVVSNAAFAVVGILGLVFVGRKAEVGPGGSFTENWERRAWGVLFAGIVLVAVGSAYYHWAPDNATLLWDRLPMTVAFTSLFGLIIAERIGMQTGRRLFWPLVATGIGSVLYWQATWIWGVEDERWYTLVQFFPLLAIPVILLLFPPRYTRTIDLLGVLGWYVLAKIFEGADALVFAAGRVVSGHTLKHLAATLAALWMLRMMKNRRPVK